MGDMAPRLLPAPQPSWGEVGGTLGFHKEQFIRSLWLPRPLSVSQLISLMTQNEPTTEVHSCSHGQAGCLVGQTAAPPPWAMWGDPGDCVYGVHLGQRRSEAGQGLAPHWDSPTVVSSALTLPSIISGLQDPARTSVLSVQPKPLHGRSLAVQGCSPRPGVRGWSVCGAGAGWGAAGPSGGHFTPQEWRPPWEPQRPVPPLPVCLQPVTGCGGYGGCGGSRGCGGEGLWGL